MIEMIEMMQKKQWDRLGRNVALVVLLMILVAGLSGCQKTLVNTKEADKAVPDPGLMVPPKKSKPMVGKVKLPKHLREQAAREKRHGDDNDRFKSLQEFQRDNQKPTPPE